jgi:methionine synthase I (cobalamin-dependent)/5,10-methylenetetrahydrofolate reductase
MDGRKQLETWLARDRPVLMDGAMGTMLYAGGIGFDACFDELTLTRPDLVAGIHGSYLAAGAQIIETNTFGANRFKLAAHGLATRVGEINAVAVELARQAVRASGSEALVAGSIGPLGVRLAPYGRVNAAQALGAFKEQIQALVEAGVDMLVIETHTDLAEVAEAVRAARMVTSIPLVASLTFTRDDRTLLGETPARTAERLAEMDLDYIGANCSGGPAQLLRVLGQMRAAAPEMRFSVMPNAGWPERVDGRIMYPATAEYFGKYARAFCQAGASIIGGCCGTTPEHIAAMHQALAEGESPCLQTAPLEDLNETRIIASAPFAPTNLASRLAEGRFLISVEMDPPRGLAFQKILAGAHLLAEAGADVISVADSPMARMRMSPWAICRLIQHDVGVDSVLHFPTRGRNMLRIQGDLLAAHALGVRNVFIVMGDPSAIGDYPEARENYDIVPSGLIRLIKHGFNAGVDQSGADIGEATAFFVGCALDLGAPDIEHELRILHKKVEAGADFALTQPIFDVERAVTFLDRYRSRYGSLSIPILAGVLPLYNERHITFLHNEVPGIQIPDGIRAMFGSVGERAPQVGVRLAVELLENLSNVVQGAYIIPAFGRYDLVAEVIDGVRGASAGAETRSQVSDSHTVNPPEVGYRHSRR